MLVKRRFLSLAIVIAVALAHWLVLTLLSQAMHSLQLNAVAHDVQISLLLDEDTGASEKKKTASHQPRRLPTTPPTVPKTTPPSEDAQLSEDLHHDADPAALDTSSAASSATDTNNTPASSLPPDADFRFAAARQLNYEVTGQSKGMNYHASGKLWWQQDGQRYTSRLEISAFLLGSRTFVSQGRISSLGLMPDTYFDPARKDQIAQFDYEVARISFADHSPDAPLLTGTQDRLSVFLQLGALLASQPDHYPTGTLLPFMTASTSATDLWQFSVEKTETLQLPYGDVPTVKLTRILRHAEDQGIEIWYAPFLDYLPARLRITKANGDYVDQQLKAVENPSP
jgi:Protein of unknown function (DUF3108)